MQKYNSTLKSLSLTLVGLLGSTLPASAQYSAAGTGGPTGTTGDARSWFGQFYTPAPPGNYGLLGQAYAGVDYSYVQRDTARPETQHKYSFTSSAPVAPGLDAALKYYYLTGGVAGRHNYENNVVAAVTAYAPMTWGKPFLGGEAGWAWAQQDGRKSDSLSWAGVAGAEFQLLPPLVLTPYVKYEARPHLTEHAWDYGAKATYRFGLEWSATVGLQVNEHHDWEYLFGLNRHF